MNKVNALRPELLKVAKVFDPGKGLELWSGAPSLVAQGGLKEDIIDKFKEALEISVSKFRPLGGSGGYDATINEAINLQAIGKYAEELCERNATHVADDPDEMQVVIVPEGVSSGDRLRVNTQTGDMIVTVPEGINAGGTITVPKIWIDPCDMADVLMRYTRDNCDEHESPFNTSDRSYHDIKYERTHENEKYKHFNCCYLCGNTLWNKYDPRHGDTVKRSKLPKKGRDSEYIKCGDDISCDHVIPIKNMYIGLDRQNLYWNYQYVHTKCNKESQAWEKDYYSYGGLLEIYARIGKSAYFSGPKGEDCESCGDGTTKEQKEEERVRKCRALFCDTLNRLNVVSTEPQLWRLRNLQIAGNRLAKYTVPAEREVGSILSRTPREAAAAEARQQALAQLQAPTLKQGWAVGWNDQGIPYFFNDATGEVTYIPENAYASAAAALFGKKSEAKSLGISTRNKSTKKIKEHIEKVVKLAKKYRIKLDKNTVKNIKLVRKLHKTAKKMKIRITKDTKKGRIYRTPKEIIREINKKRNF